MKNTLILFGLVAATFISCQGTPKLESNTGQRLLGTLEVSFGAENGRAKATFSPVRIAGQALVNEAQLLFTAGTYSTATQTTPSKKFLNAQFAVRNLSGASISNLTLVAYRKNGNIGNTALKSVTDFGGISTNSVRNNLRVATVASYAQSVRPSQAMSGNGTVAVVSGQEDLALFTEYDLNAMTTTAGAALASGEYLLPYGFTVRDLAAPNASTQRTITANNSTNTGTVTLAMAVDGSNEPTLPTAYRFSFTTLVFENPTPITQVSGSLEEKPNSNVETRRTTLSPAKAVTVYSASQNGLADFTLHQNGQFANACQVRIAGTAATPEAYLESVAPSVISSELNNCFGAGGVHTVNNGQRYINTDVALLSDGRFATVGQYSSGTTTTGSYATTVLPDGSRQALRSINAHTTTTGSTYITSIAVDSQNRIIRAGYTEDLGVTAVVIGRNLPDATLSNDTTFSSTDHVITTIHVATGSEHVINDIAVQSDDKIVVVGRVKNGTAGNNDVLVIRYNTNGTLDTTFNTTGYVIDDVDGGGLDNQALSVLIDSSGKIIVAGKQNNPGAFLMMRFTSAGARDLSFNSIGHKIQGITNGTDDAANSIALQGTKILFSGYTNPNANQTGIAVLRINNDGTLDTTFATGGELTYTNTNPARFRATKIIVQPNNRILIAGTSVISTLEKAFIARYLDTGAPDNSFWSNTIHIRIYNNLQSGNTPLDTEATSALLLGTPTNGKLLISGTFNDSNILGNRRGMLAQFNLGAN
jgi:uncharacterized delta-60 repeat protein